MRVYRYILEALLYAAIIAGGLFVLSSFDTFEFIHEFSRSHEHYEIDEMLLSLPLVLVCLLIFVWKRLQEMLQSRRELRATNAKLAELGSFKEEFMAVACHELRSPLSGVVSALNLVKMSETEEERMEYVEHGIASASQLGKLISDVMLYSRDPGEGELDVGEVSLPSLMESIRIMLQAQAEEKGLQLTLGLEAGSADTVYANEGVLRLVALNLVGNSIKYTDSGEIVVSCRIDEEPHRELVLTVRDTGIGIAAGDLDAIFEPYRRGGGVPKGMKGGLGLGLSIVKRLVGRMNGTITVSSDLGEGSEFTVRIPVPAR